tara:strand:- start:992 stop:1516 length:525 start_codon:yes stop_codon:yes gene_type:complete
MINTNTQITFISIISVLVLYLLFPIYAESNGRITKYETYTDDQHIIKYGVYPETIFTGPLHIAVSVQDKDTEMFLKAKVNINLTGPEFNKNIEAKNSLDSPQFYEYDTVLKNEGEYNLDISIESSKGISFIKKQFEASKGTDTANLIIIFFTFIIILVPFSIALRKIIINKNKI